MNFGKTEICLHVTMVIILFRSADDILYAKEEQVHSKDFRFSSSADDFLRTNEEQVHSKDFRKFFFKCRRFFAY